MGDRVERCIRLLMPLACLFPILFVGISASRAQTIDPLEESIRLAAEADRLWPLADWAGAETVLLQALRLREQALGPLHADVARLIDRVGRTHFNRHNYDLAADWFREAAEVGERTLGPLHLDLADYLGDLGAALRDAGRPEEGEPHVLRSLSIRRTLLGPEAQPVGASLLNLGRNYMLQGRYAEGEAVLAEASAILQRTMGDAPLARMAQAAVAGATRDAHRRWLVMVSLIGALLAGILLVGLATWIETPRSTIPARWVWMGAHLMMLAAWFGFYGASFFVAGLYLGPMALNAFDMWGDIPRGFFKLIGFAGWLIGYLTLTPAQNVLRWALRRPATWSVLPYVSAAGDSPTR